MANLIKKSQYRQLVLMVNQWSNSKVMKKFLLNILKGVE